MKLEDQVVSLELAKKLKELGVKQESVFYWIDECKNGDWEIAFEDEWDTVSGEWGDGSVLKDHPHFSAYTVAELGEILPLYLILPYTLGRDKQYNLKIEKYANGWNVSYGRWGEPRNTDTEANARAKMVIYLKENKLI